MKQFDDIIDGRFPELFEKHNDQLKEICDDMMKEAYNMALEKVSKQIFTGDRINDLMLITKLKIKE